MQFQKLEDPLERSSYIWEVSVSKSISKKNIFCVRLRTPTILLVSCCLHRRSFALRWVNIWAPVPYSRDVYKLFSFGKLDFVVRAVRVWENNTNRKMSVTSLNKSVALIIAWFVLVSNEEPRHAGGRGVWWFGLFLRCSTGELPLISQLFFDYKLVWRSNIGGMRVSWHWISRIVIWEIARAWVGVEKSIWSYPRLIVHPGWSMESFTCMYQSLKPHKFIITNGRWEQMKMCLLMVWSARGSC